MILGCFAVQNSVDKWRWCLKFWLHPDTTESFVSCLFNYSLLSARRIRRQESYIFPVDKHKLFAIHHWMQRILIPWKNVRLCVPPTCSVCCLCGSLLYITLTLMDLERLPYPADLWSRNPPCISSLLPRFLNVKSSVPAANETHVHGK